MAITTAGDIISQAGEVLHDTGHVRWTQADLLGWINAAQKQIASLKPEAVSAVAVHELAAGTRQTLPADGFGLIDISRNIKATDAPGAVVTVVSREFLDADPDWHSATPATEIMHFTYDERDPVAWYCCPPSDGTGRVEVVYSKVPAKLTEPENGIGVNDIYANAILDYVLYRSYSRDSQDQTNATRAAAYYQSFLQALGLWQQTAAKADPNVNTIPAANAIAG